MYEFIVRDCSVSRERGYSVVRVRMVEVYPRLVPERSEIELYLQEDEPGVLRYFDAAHSGKPIKVDFSPETPVEPSEAW